MEVIFNLLLSCETTSMMKLILNIEEGDSVSIVSTENPLG